MSHARAPADRAFFAQVSHGCRAVVVASELPCAGTRLGMRQLNPVDRSRLAWEVRAYTHSSDLPQLDSLGFVKSSDLPRAGGVVRLELKEFCTSVERLAWAKAKGCRWDGLTCATAAAGGHLEALSWARENGCPWGYRTCRFAAQGGHVEVLQWARAHGCPWHQERICFHAVEGGSLEMLKWLREIGCPSHASSCSAAAQGGHLEVLKWARQQDCPWNVYN